LSKYATLIAIDQSSSKSGIAVFDGTDLMRRDIIKLPASVPADRRNIEMMHQIEVLLQRYQPDTVIIEDVQMQKSVYPVIILARLQGMIMALCDRYKVDCKMYLPTTWRKQLGFQQGKGVTRQDLKQQATDFVNASYGINVGEDVSEAICIGLAHLNYIGALPTEKNERMKKPHDSKEA